jgi:hypothetical protein
VAPFNGGGKIKIYQGTSVVVENDKVEEQTKTLNKTG